MIIMSLNEIWDEIVRYSGKEIEMYNKNKFTYIVSGGCIYIAKANWRITKAEIEIAVEKLKDPSFAKLAKKAHHMCMQFFLIFLTADTQRQSDLYFRFDCLLVE